MSAKFFSLSVALGVCAAFINLLVWHQPIMAMASGHTLAFKALYAMWFLVAWGVAAGALTSLAISSIRRRGHGRLSAAVAFVVSIVLTSIVCLVLYRGLTDTNFMRDAMGGSHVYDANSQSTMPGMDMDMNMDMDPAHSQLTRLNLLGALTPNFLAVALSVIYAFGGKGRGIRGD
jgi:glucan phosphoethanolaminetransferase (alkaline phosphatase superfamily)